MKSSRSEQEEGTQCTKSPSIRHFRGFFGELQQSYGTLNMRNTSGSFSLGDFGIVGSTRRRGICVFFNRMRQYVHDADSKIAVDV